MANVKLSNNVLIVNESICNGINGSNLLVAKTGKTAEISWTATQDCWIIFKALHTGIQTFGSIDGIEVYKNYDVGANGIETASVALCKKGQVVKMWKGYYHEGYPFTFNAYGLK